jgi:hypothetical protein
MQRNRGGWAHVAFPASVSAIGLLVFVALAGQIATAAEIEDPIQGLEGMVRGADFDAAEIKAQGLLASGSLTRRQVARIYLELGIVASARRDPTKGEMEFRRALRLDDDLELSAWVGPQVVETFDRAKTALSTSTTAAPTVSLAPLPGTAKVSVEVAAKTDDDGLARHLLVRLADLREMHDLGEAPIRFLLSLPASIKSCATVKAGVLDEYGNELWPEVASAELCRPLSLATPNSVRTTYPDVPTIVLSSNPGVPSRPIPRSVWVAAAATGAVALSTAVLGLVALEMRSEYDDSLTNSAGPAEQRQLRDSAATAEHRATVATVVTAALAGTTAVLYVKGRF